MKVCFIFSPFSSLTYVPLGISYLKGFIKKYVPSACVKNFDLSNHFYHKLDNEKFSNSLLGLCQICPENKKSKCGGLLKRKEFARYRKAALVSKNMIADAKAEEFYIADKYNAFRRMSGPFYEQISTCLEKVLKCSFEAQDNENGAILRNILFKEDIDRIASERPDVIGFSVFSHEQLFYSLAFAKILKAQIKPKIIFGGAYISHLDKEEILKSFDFIDFIIYKEGELGIGGLLKNLKEENFDGVPNLIYKKGSKVVENAESAVRNLDEIPFPDFSDYNLKRYFSPRPVLSTLFSRGCFWGGCTFCALSKSFTKPYRTRSISNLMLELEHYQKQGIKHIWFSDEMIKAEDLGLINESSSRKKLNMYYGVMLKPTRNFTYEILKKMFEGGCRCILWGVESFDPRVLNLMNKGTHFQEIEGVLRDSYNEGLANTVFMIQGFPTQTEEEILGDMEFLRKNAKYIYNVTAHPFWLETDTAIFRNPQRFELKCLKRNYLLNTKKYKLSSASVSYDSEKKIDYQRLDELRSMTHQKIKFSCGFHHETWEHQLLHLARSCENPVTSRS